MATDRIGFIGLGRMGAGMAINLARAGVDLTVFDALPAAVERLTAQGAKAAATPAEVASRVDRLFLCLPFAPEVRSVLFECDANVFEGAGDGLAIVDTTTLNHGDCLEIAAEVESRGASYADCPISGMPFRAENGTLTMMYGGSDHAFAAVEPLLGHMGEFIVHCGPTGSGQLMKAINNIIYNINIAAICEVLPLAVKGGLDPDTVASVVTSGSSRSFASEYFVPRILDRKFDTDFAMQAAYKDIVNVQQLATRVGAATPVVSAMVSTYQQTMAMGFGSEPKSAMIKLYERVLGVEVTHRDPD